MRATILTNLVALNITRHLEKNRRIFEKSAERLASGKRINQMSDDAAGAAISTSLEAQIRSIIQASRNAQDAISLFQVAGGAMSEISSIFVRLRELAIQASSDTVGDEEREMLAVEASQLKEEVDRIADSTRYLGTNLLNGAGRDFTFQIGVNDDETNRIGYDASQIDVRTSTLGIDDIDMSSIDAAQGSLGHIDDAISRLHVPRANMGAMQSRLESTINFLGVSEEGFTAAQSRILDADVAREASDTVKGQVLQKSGIAVLSQANMLPALILKILGDN